MVDKAQGYGIRGHSVDGTDLTACLKVVGEAVDRARAGGGPQLVVASLLRLAGHGEHDDANYVDPKLRDSSLGHDCLKLAEQRLLEKGWASAASVQEWQEDALRQIEEAVATTLRESPPDPNEETWCALSMPHLSDGFSAA